MSIPISQRSKRGKKEEDACAGVFAGTYTCTDQHRGVPPPFIHVCIVRLPGATTAITHWSSERSPACSSDASFFFLFFSRTITAPYPATPITDDTSTKPDMTLSVTFGKMKNAIEDANPDCIVIFANAAYGVCGSFYFTGKGANGVRTPNVSTIVSACSSERIQCEVV